MQQLTAGACPLHKRKKATKKDQHIKELKDRFSRSDYVAGMSQHINF